jgi:hypothetical protein
MPVTHGVAGSSPVRTAKTLSEVILRGFFVFWDYIRTNPKLKKSDILISRPIGSYLFKCKTYHLSIFWDFR